jgi:alpha-1,3-glucosyltransferase
MSRTDRRLPLIALLACAQLLLAPAYRSTDFEVHRNWLAVTHSLPLSQWYLDATSPWTLDYPPLFAWFERLLGLPAALADAEMLRVSALDYASPATVLYQRLTVSVTGLVLAAAAWRGADMRGGSGGARSLRGQLVFFSVAASAGLLLVDNVHFQYNGVLLGEF